MALAARSSPGLGRSGRWILFAAVAVLRLGLAGLIADDPEKALWPDSASYMIPAEQSAAGAGYTDPQGTADLYRPPAYPLFLAAHKLLFGELVVPSVVTQLLLGVGVAGLLYGVGKRVWGDRIGYTAALLYLLTPNAALWALAILSDPVYVLVATATVACLAGYGLTGRARWAAAAGLLSGLGILVRPIGSVMVALWALFLLLTAGFRLHSPRRAVVAAGLLLTASAVVVLPWMLRNARDHGLFTVSPISTWYLGRYVAPAALAAAEDISLEEAREQIPTSRIPQPGERERYLSVILDHPLGYLEAHARGTWYILSEASQPNLAQLLDEHSGGKGILTALREEGLAAAWERTLVVLRDPRMRWTATLPWLFQAFQLVVYALAARALFTGFGPSPIQRWLGWLIVVTCAGFLLIPGPVGTGRFRLPAEPLLAMLAAIGVWLPGRVRAAAAEPAAGEAG